MDKRIDSAKPGALRRKIVVRLEQETAWGGVEDDFHHFVIRIDHNGQRVTEVDSQDRRTPWLSCARAGTMLDQLVGVRLSTDIFDTTGHIDPHEQCTHQFDLALLVIACAARGTSRTYELEVSDAVDNRRRVLVLRDGVPCIDWVLEGTQVVTPPDWAGTNLRSLDVRRLAKADREMAEAVSALRRAVMIAGGRGIDFDQFEDARVFADRMSGACFSFQPVRIIEAKRNKNSVRDFSEHPELLLKDFPS